MIKSWSHTQAVIALSPGEAEYYGTIKGASYSLGIQSLAVDLGIEMGAQVPTDSSAAKGTVVKEGDWDK